MIRTVIPTTLSGDLALAYNTEMEALPSPADYLAILDHDAMFTTYHWREQLSMLVGAYPECDCFVGITNRIGGSRQLHAGKNKSLWNSNDIELHRAEGQRIYEQKCLQVEDFSKPTPHHLSGFFMLVKKEAWLKVGGFKHWDSNKSKMLGVDSRFHEDLHKQGLKVCICKGLYLYHWYRNGKNTKNHLEKR